MADPQGLHNGVPAAPASVCRVVAWSHMYFSMLPLILLLTGIIVSWLALAPPPLRVSPVPLVAAMGRLKPTPIP